MSDDIVERLRGYCGDAGYDAMRRDAADEIEALRAKVEALEGERAWRPISEAPLDRNVLVFCERDGVCEARFYTEGVEPGWCTYGVNGVFRCRPTAWQPLPIPPKAAP